MHVSVALFLLGLAFVIQEGEGSGAGRAFPIHSENYAIEAFKSLNPSIEWDPTNFLVDKSGEYANCDQLRRGYEKLNDVTPEGNSIVVMFGHMSGDGSDVDSVNSYILTLIEGWMVSGGYYDGTILSADVFGCSVRPGCQGVVTIACLFSPAGDEDQNDRPEYSGEPNTPSPSIPHWQSTTSRPTNIPNVLPQEPITQLGQAFTAEQYDLAEYITGHKWDRSHFLENLSGYEISCSMLEYNDWTFVKSIELAKEYGMRVMGLHGQAPNMGSTQQAMEVILKQFKAIQSATNVGCSLIPDCTSGRGDLGDEMWVIVTCIYQETL